MNYDAVLRELGQQARALRLERNLLQMQKAVLKGEYERYPANLKLLRVVVNDLSIARSILANRRTQLASATGEEYRRLYKSIQEASGNVIELEQQQRDLLERIAPLTEAALKQLEQKQDEIRAIKGKMEDLEEALELLHSPFEAAIFDRHQQELARVPYPLSSSRCQGPDRLLLTNRFMTPRPPKKMPKS